MGYYCAWGDAKMTCSSEEEDYENCNPDIGEKKGESHLEIHGEAPIAPALPVSDDTDRQFWAEDELSGSESRQRLITRRKRRHSISYRNRTTNRSQSCIPRPSHSSSDSIRMEISPKIRRIQKYWLNPEKLQSTQASCTSIEEMICTINKGVCPGHQVTSALNLDNHEAILSYINGEGAINVSRNAKKIRVKRSRRLTKFKPFKQK